MLDVLYTSLNVYFFIKYNFCIFKLIENKRFKWSKLYVRQMCKSKNCNYKNK